MPRDYKAHLEDILEAVRKIRTYTAKLSLEWAIAPDGDCADEPPFRTP